MNWFKLRQGAIAIDFETYSATDLIKHDTVRYVNDPYFKPLIASVFSYELDTVYTFDFVTPTRLEKEKDAFFRMLDQASQVIAHNAFFEECVLEKMGYPVEQLEIVDSAVLARQLGASSSLEAASQQILGTGKLPSGRDLIQLFCIPDKDADRANPYHMQFDEGLPRRFPLKWKEFTEYCERDAELSLRLAQAAEAFHIMDETEQAQLTRSMNRKGWPVDILSVLRMKQIYQENLDRILQEFFIQFNEDINFNSSKQLQDFCRRRGVRAQSFSKDRVIRLINRLEKILSRMNRSDTRFDPISEVLSMLRTKQELGGSSLKKLDVILDRHYQGRLYNSYLHVGAGQTFRTSGRGVQMQNLTRLHNIRNMDDLHDGSVMWSNDVLSENMRQLFKGEDDKLLIVADYSSVESRGLAYLAGAEWKLDAFREGRDMYKVLASKIDGTSYESVTPERRQFGKVGELSCGYQAGPRAVKDFAEKMGTILTEAEAGSLVGDWRHSNPEVVNLWSKLDGAIRTVVSNPSEYPIRSPLTVTLDLDGLQVRMHATDSPHTLQQILPNAKTLFVRVVNYIGARQAPSWVRLFHGVHMVGGSVHFYRPSASKTGSPWVKEFRHPTTKRMAPYSIYGGKLSGILTQSLCREIFFDALLNIKAQIEGMDGVNLIGQFHDEIVIEAPGMWYTTVKEILLEQMSHTDMYPSLPLAVEVDGHERYIK